jgi:phosphopantothenoylcysteine decarboxylase/phosphopantothenate--cysteine ligase
MLQNKNILIGITGGIAAYKIPLLVRLLKLQKANVKVICTPAALQFVTQQTLSVLSEQPVLVDFFDPESGQWNHHVQLGIWADALIIAPCGSNTISKMVSGQCDNLLLTTYLSARCPVWIAPAMDLDMFQQESVQTNLNTLHERGVQIIDAEDGPLASGLSGKGRMAEPDTIYKVLHDHFTPQNSGFIEKKVVVTAGPTYESIDPVRFIGNHSTGQMGIEIAKVLSHWGADVHLILGPSSVEVPSYMKLTRVVSAQEMFTETQKAFSESDILIMSAAVADYRIEQPSSEKIKKSEDQLTLNLVKNIDILKTLSQSKLPNQKTIGFALETQNGLDNALEKLSKKKLDAVILNLVSDHSGFKTSTNKIHMIHRSGKQFETEIASKSEIAAQIIETLNSWIFD